MWVKLDKIFFMVYYRRVRFFETITANYEDAMRHLISALAAVAAFLLLSGGHAFAQEDKLPKCSAAHFSEGKPVLFVVAYYG